MKGKLYKTNNDTYILVDLTKGTYDKGYVLGTSRESDVNKLSIKNCQAIENGYDLDELAYTDSEEFVDNFDYNDGYGNICRFNNSHEVQECYIKGFQKALEILGDKKFSEKELTMLFAYGHQIGMNDVLAIQSQHSPQPMPKPDSDKLRDEFIQSLQQTEWDVEICCYVDNSDGWLDADSFNSPLCTNTGIPKLDENECLILKRI
jgi:hypothetical protein